MEKKSKRTLKKKAIQEERGERWRTVKRHPNYLISDRGNVKSLRTGKILRVWSPNSRGYAIATLDGKFQSVHRLVAEAFVKVPDAYKSIPVNELTVNHKDENKLNNWAENLEWLTISENIQYSAKTRKYGKKPILKVNKKSGKVKKVYASMAECARDNNFAAQDIKYYVYTKRVFNDCILQYADDIKDTIHFG